MPEATVSFAGNLTDDPEIRYTESSIARELGGVGGLIQQRLQGRVLQRRGGLRVVEHLLERLVDPQRLADLLDRAGVVPRVSSRAHLRAQDECLHRREVWQAFVAFDMLEDGVEQLQRRP